VILRAAFVVLCCLPPGAHAQAAKPPAPAGQSAPAGKQADVVTLGEVRVTAPRPETLDLYGFRNPVEVRENVFAKAYREPPSLQEIGENGGIIPYAVGYLVGKLGGVAEKIPGYKRQVRNAIARPPPLDDALLERARWIGESADAPRNVAPPAESGPAATTAPTAP
jgi:hypothetical protein